MALTRGTPMGGAKVPFRTSKIDYNTVAAIKLIQDYGGRYDWHNGLVCPCTIKSQSDDRKFRQLLCPLCNGTGWTYIFKKEIRCVSSSQRRDEQTLTYRVPQPGVMSNIFVNMTCEPENKVNIRDRLIFKESVTFRSEGKTYSAATSLYTFTFPIVELLRVIDENGVKYDCTHLYTDRRDVDSDADGNLFWVEGKDRPAEGLAFSILYSFYPSYIVITAAHEIRGFTAGKQPPDGTQAYEDLPRSFVAKLEIPEAYLF